MQRIFNNKLWLAASLALLMTGCWLDGSSSKNTNNGGVNPASDLAVTSTMPADLATDVATNGNVTAAFSQAMDPATITGTTFTLMAGETPVVGEVTYAGTVATFNPTADLAANTVYTAVISTGAKNVAGNNLPAKKAWSFKTGTAPTVTSTIPADLDLDVALNRNIIATFSEAMDFTTVNPTTFTLTYLEGDVLVPVPGDVTYAGTIATFNPTNDLTAGKEFTATLTTAAKDLSGDALPFTVSWRFTTGTAIDDTVPTVSSTSPADTQVDSSLVATNRNVTVTFSETMDPATITATTFIVKTGEVLIPGVVSYAGKVATFNPISDLPANTILVATVTTGAKDLAGIALVANVEWRFTTGAMADDTVPAVSGTAPLNAAVAVSANGNVTATFSEAMDPATINTTTFTLTFMDGETLVPVPAEVTYAGLVATLNPSNSLPGDKLITATVTTGVKDLVGNALANDNTWTFTTGAAGPAPVNLGAASTFAILTATGITDTDSHTSVVNGNVGASPISGASIGLTCAEVPTGIIYSVDATGPLPCRVTDATLLTSAIGDMGIAYADAAGRTLPDHTEFGSGEIGGQTMPPGLYKWGTSVSISNDVTLAGGPNDVWIFQIAGDLTMASAKSVTLAGGAQAKNVFWQVAGGAGVALGTTAHFEGTLLAKTLIALGTGASVNGRLLAQTAATLQGNAVTKPAM